MILDHFALSHICDNCPERVKMTHYIISFCVLQFAMLKFLVTNKEETTEVHKKS